MIDAILNSHTGPALVHDELDLEGARAFEVSPRGDGVLVRFDGTRRAVGARLDPDVARAFRSVDTCPVIRMDGSRVASQGRIRIALETAS